ncbi:MAG: hypothetical protein QGI45_10075 [Myxococcota bacterium]|jgi:hypothetical protein|nr:hypothetical protein [Myxococcota bacterium]
MKKMVISEKTKMLSVAFFAAVFALVMLGACGQEYDMQEDGIVLDTSQNDANNKALKDGFLKELVRFIKDKIKKDPAYEEKVAKKIAKAVGKSLLNGEPFPCSRELYVSLQPPLHISPPLAAGEYVSYEGLDFNDQTLSLRCGYTWQTPEQDAFCCLYADAVIGDDYFESAWAIQAGYNFGCGNASLRINEDGDILCGLNLGF